jgi:hypothetical protein
LNTVPRSGGMVFNDLGLGEVTDLDSKVSSFVGCF